MPLKIVIVGSSGHINYIEEADSSQFDLIALAPGAAGEDMSALRGREFARGAAYYDDWRRMLDETSPDLVVNNTWFGEAGKITLEALGRGIHVFCEKPLSGSLEELEAIEDCRKKGQARLGGMFGISYEGPFLRALRFMREEGIGDVRLLHAQKSYRLGTRPDFYRKRETFTGIIPWVGSHGIDWILRFSGKKVLDVTACHSALFNRDHGELESSAACLLRMEDGVCATLNIDYLRPEGAETHGDDRIRIAGSEGILEIREGRVIHTGPEGTRVLENLPDRSVFDAFLGTLEGPPDTGPDSLLEWDLHALEVTRLCLLARKSADEGLTISAS